MNRIQYCLFFGIFLVCVLSLYIQHNLLISLEEAEKEIKQKEEFISGLENSLSLVLANNYNKDLEIHQKNLEINDLLYLEIENERLRCENQEWEQLFEDMFKVRATAYAPLCDTAIEGWCYSGDPTVTASGNPSIPNHVVAMDPKIPFGTEVLVEGFGKRVVHDRGGAIKGNAIDIMMDNRTQARRFGVQHLNVLILESE